MCVCTHKDEQGKKDTDTHMHNFDFQAVTGGRAHANWAPLLPPLSRQMPLLSPIRGENSCGVDDDELSSIFGVTKVEKT